MIKNGNLARASANAANVELDSGRDARGNLPVFSPKRRTSDFIGKITA
jgi:hypothetical protein